jgi:hypothetical protein
VIEPEWVTAVAESVTALGLTFTYFLLRDSHEQLKTAKDVLEATRQQTMADHERSRREGAVQYLLIWSNTLTRASGSAAQLVDHLEFQKCKRIAAREEVEIHKDHAELLAACFQSETQFQAKGDHVALTVQQSAELRALLVKYLNILETIMCAWSYSSVDQGIIEKQFSYLMVEQDNRRMLRNFREAIGVQNFPEIAKFEQHIIDKRAKERHSQGKPAL